MRLHTAFSFFFIIFHSPRSLRPALPSLFSLLSLLSLFPPPSIRPSHMKDKAKVVRELFFYSSLSMDLQILGAPYFPASMPLRLPIQIISTFPWKHFSPSNSTFLLHTSPAELHGLIFRSTRFGPMKEKREKQEVSVLHCFFAPCGMLAFHRWSLRSFAVYYTKSVYST